MKLIPSLGEVKIKAIAAAKRFPIVLVWAVVGTLFVVNVIVTDSFDISQNQKVIITFVLGISWLIASRFFIEQFKKDKEWISLITVGLLVLFYFSLIAQNDTTLSTVTYIRFWMYIIIGHVFVFVAPFIFLWNKIVFFNYIKNIGVAIFRSAFFSFIIFGGISLALLAVENLFDFKIKGERYLQLFVFCLGIINTWIYLSDFPKNIYAETKLNYTKPLEVLVKYILIPLVILYILILYAYAIKIIIQWSLPKGWVSYLVIALSFLGFSIQMLINPIQKTIKSKFINIFYPWFYYLLLPLIGLLFVAIFRRITEYGFTENRYLVLALSCWILVAIIYMLFSKNKQIRFFSISFICLFLFISFGFWGVFKISINSQLKRFETSYSNLKEKNFIVTNGEKNQFRDITLYMFERNQFEKVAPILGFNPKETYKDVKWKWSIVNKVIDTLNIKITDTENIEDALYGRNFYLNFNQETISVSGYDFLKNLNFTSYNNKTQNINNYSFFLDTKASVLKVFTSENNKVNEIDLNDFFKNILQNSIDDRNRTLYEMTLIKEFDDVGIKIIFSSLNFEYKQKTAVKVSRINAANMYIFIKEK